MAEAVESIAGRREAIRAYLVHRGPAGVSDIMRGCGLTKAKVYYALRDEAMFFQHRDSRWDVPAPAEPPAPPRTLLDRVGPIEGQRSFLEGDDA